MGGIIPLVHDTHADFLFVVMLVCKMLLWRIEGHLLFRGVR